MFRIFLLLLCVSLLEAKPLTSLISNMIIIGFEGESVPPKLAHYIKKHGIGGVILFSKNIKNTQQLKTLTASLQALSVETIMIATDQEGGLVQRLSAKNGFVSTPKPSVVSQMGVVEASKLYSAMAKMLSSNGINVNFAPSVDLAVNPKNVVIYKYGRSFSKAPKEVIKYADIFIKAMEKEGVLSVIKHFPGHGSSMGDSHKGFVDVSETWHKKELEPFFALPAKAVMSAHIFNKNIDKTYPATLSLQTNALLRARGYDGLLISDDLQMKAISDNYDLNTTLTKAINASVDMLLFGNQLSKPIMIDTLVSRIEVLVKKGYISMERIKEANTRINRIKEGLKIDARR